MDTAGRAAALNAARYPDFEFVTGGPALAAQNPDRHAAEREAFAALQIARRRAASGDRQRVYLGEPAVRLAYGRPKQKGEPDCDVIGYLLHGGAYAFLLAEGKGADIVKAKSQFEAVVPKLAQLRPDAANADAPGAAPTAGALIVTNSLRYLEWRPGRRQWVTYLNASEEPHITSRLQPVIARAEPGLQQEKIYLVDGPEDPRDSLPSWAVNLEKQPFTVWEQNRGRGMRGSFRPVMLGTGPLQLFYVA